MRSQQVPAISTNQMRKVDRLMIAEYGITLIQMMENAGRNLAELAFRLLDHRLAGRLVVVLAGGGNNGDGGMAAARHLCNRGVRVHLNLSSTSTWDCKLDRSLLSNRLSKLSCQKHLKHADYARIKR